MFRTAWNTEGKILEPPGSPTARTGRPSRDPIVGAIELVMRFLGATDRACPGWGSKRPIVLLSRRPVPGTVAFEPKVASIVCVAATTLPSPSATVTWVVCGDVDTGTPAGCTPVRARSIALRRAA